MGLLKQWLYFLTDEAGNSYRKNGSIVETTGTPTPLDITPDAWQDKTIKYGRNIRYKGMFRAFSTPLRFVKDAATIIRSLAINVGFEAKLFLVIHRLDERFGMGWIHKLFFYGEMDLAKLESEEDFATCNIMEGGLDKLLKANENTQYEISLPEIIKHDGVKLLVKYEYQMIDDTINYAVPFTAFPIVSLSETRFGLYPTTQSGGDPATPERIIENVFTKTITVTLEGTLSLSLPAGGALFRVYIELRDSNDALRSYILNTGDITAATWSTNLFYFVNLQPGDYISILLEQPFLGTGPGGFDPDNNRDVKWGADKFTVSFDYRHPTSQVTCINPVDLGQALIDKIAPGYFFASSYFQTEWRGLKITGGDAIRGLSGAKMKTSFADFFDSMNAVTNCQLFIKDKTVYIEAGAEAFGSTTRLSLGSAAKFKWKFADDFLYNTVKVGYPDVQLQDVNGKYEFNVTNSFTSSVARVVRELNLVSKYSASMYEMEFIRINLEGKATTNSETDASCYFIHCNDLPELDESGLFYAFTLRRDTYDDVLGLYDPASAYNIEISPKRNLLRHGSFIRSVFYFQQASNLVFQTSNQNAALETVINGSIISPEVRIKEGADVVISLLDRPVFIPIVFEFDSPVPIDIIEVMEANPSDTFEFELDGVTMKGFPMEVSIQPSNMPAQTSQLLCSPETDITKLIK